jgi:hypothetical protein
MLLTRTTANEGLALLSIENDWKAHASLRYGCAKGSRLLPTIPRTFDALPCHTHDEYFCLKFPYEINFIMELYGAVKGFYVDGLPRHLHANASELSTFRVISRRELVASPPEALQDSFRHKHFIVTDTHQPWYGFDEDGLRTLGPNLDREITIHGSFSRFSVTVDLEV